MFLEQLKPPELVKRRIFINMTEFKHLRILVRKEWVNSINTIKDSFTYMVYAQACQYLLDCQDIICFLISQLQSQKPLSLRSYQQAHPKNE